MGGMDARNPTPGAPPTNNADVDMVSEVPRLDAMDYASSDEAISNGMSVELALEKDEPPEFVLSDSQKIVYSFTDLIKYLSAGPLIKQTYNILCFIKLYVF